MNVDITTTTGTIIITISDMVMTMTIIITTMDITTSMAREAKAFGANLLPRLRVCC